MCDLVENSVFSYPLYKEITNKNTANHRATTINTRSNNRYYLPLFVWCNMSHQTGKSPNSLQVTDTFQNQHFFQTQTVEQNSQATGYPISNTKRHLAQQRMQLGTSNVGVRTVCQYASC